MTTNPQSAMLDDDAPVTPTLQATGISVRYGGLHALELVDLNLLRGEVLGLVGPNGAGKTTMLGVLSGLIRPSGGKILLDGREITRLGPQYRARLGVARSFQVPLLIEDLTVRDHLRLALKVSKNQRVTPEDTQRRASWMTSWRRGRVQVPDDQRTRVDDVLAHLGLEKYANVIPLALPLGTQRLVEVGQALVTNPRILLLDEPSAGLNSFESDEFGRSLRVARDRFGLSIVLVEHDFDLVFSLCDRVQVLNFGTTLVCGSVDEIRADQSFREAYLGENLADGIGDRTN
jgi:ABC-type branched-subunit amino acid transport system ATPase component